MEKIAASEKKKLSQKLLEFQKTGLASYGKYLAKQYESAAKSTSKNAYKHYIENQIELNKEKIDKIDKKLN